MSSLGQATIEDVLQRDPPDGEWSGDGNPNVALVCGQGIDEPTGQKIAAWWYKRGLTITIYLWDREGDRAFLQESLSTHTTFNELRAGKSPQHIPILRPRDEVDRPEYGSITSVIMGATSITWRYYDEEEIGFVMRWT